jgi:hypothetical protein
LGDGGNVRRWDLIGANGTGMAYLVSMIVLIFDNMCFCANFSEYPCIY